jgi:integrase
LQEQLQHGKHDQLSLLFTTEGKAFDPVYMGGWFKDAITAAGLPDDCQLHGLRKTAAKMLAEAGCTELEIMAITGHTTSRMIAKYTKDADQHIRAEAAIRKLENRQ